MFVHDLKKRIRYGETDQMGYMYYGNYCLLYEIGRAEALRSIGASYRDLEVVHKIMMPVAYVESRFIKPAKYDELITIRSILKEMPTKLTTFYHEIYNEENELLHKGIVKLFMIDMETDKRVSFPEHLVTILKPSFE